MSARQKDYIYAAARIGALERSILSQEQYHKLISAPLGSERQVLISFGYACAADTPLVRAIEDRTKEAFAAVCEAAPDAAVFDVFRYPYDCLNLKALIKCARRAGFSAEDFLSPLGTVPPETAKNSALHGDFGCYPSHMREAISQVLETYAKTGRPSDIDMPLDAACFADMRASAARRGISALSAYVTRKIDIRNTVTCARLWKREPRIFQKAFLPGGSLSFPSLEAALADGAFSADLFRGTMLEGIGEALTAASDAEAAERLLDAYEMACLRPYRYDCFGAERLIGYLAAYEAEGRNLRVILAGRAAGADGEIIRERLCLGYV